MSELPAVSAVVPHSGPMSLVDELVHSSEDGLLARLRVRGDGFFDHGGKVPACIGIEYMAQTVAAFSGLSRWREGKSIRVGFLLGTRRFESSGGAFSVGETVEVEVTRVIQAAGGMGAFDCEVRGQTVTQRARLSVYEPPEGELEREAT